MKTNVFIIFIALFLCLLLSPKANAYEPYPYQTYPNYTNYSDYSDYADEVEIGYPAIDELERKILGGVYTQEDVYQRLNRLETKVFGQATNEPLDERVDRLKAAAGISSPANRDQNIIFGMGNKRYNNNYYGYKNSYNRYDNYYNEYDRYDEDDFYDRQASYGQYRNMSTEASILSLIFMIIQSFL
jgi:hypothetical protein